MSAAPTALSAATAPDAAPQMAQRRERYELSFLDGLRALAALYVLLHHAYCKPIADKALWSDGIIAMPVWSNWLLYGNFAVDVFIVLSGFLLALPVASASVRMLEGGVGSYLQRRARRILPPYYAALVFSALIMAAGVLLSDRTGVKRDVSGDLNAGSLLSHLLLVHNLFPAWHKLINAPLWSVATEWQIYFVFPLVLIPVWRRFGVWAALCAGLTLGIAPHLFRLPWADSAQSWQLGLFSMGMTAASLFVKGQRSAKERGLLVPASRRGWGIAGGTLALLVIVLLNVQPHWYEWFLWCFDLMVGAATVCLILFCAPVAAQAGMKRPFILRVMEGRFAQSVGKFSYSLYLTHSPILALTYLVVRRLHLPLGASLVALMVLGTAISLGCAYLFYLAFEKPFLRRRGGVAARPAPTGTATGPTTDVQAA